MKVLFRADGNRQTGLGHLYRTRALWEIFSARYSCKFLSRSGSDLSMFDGLLSSATIPDQLSTMEEAEWIYESFPPSEYLLVIDGYDFGLEYQIKIKSLGYHLIYIDDLMAHKQVADLVINHAEAIEKKDYDLTLFTRLALGADYAILRKDFLDLAKISRESIGPIHTVLICFGGSDSNNFSYKACKALLEFPEFKKIQVVIGSSYQGDDLFTLPASNPKVVIHQALDSSGLARIMLESQLAIAPASTILYELCAAKIPILAGYYVKNQQYLYKGMQNAGCIYSLGDISEYKSEDFKTSMADFLQTVNIDKFIKAQTAFLDGKSGSRLLELLNRPVLRLATEKDLMLVFYWSNDPLTRKNSFSSEPIDLETHKNWFSARLLDENSILMIAEQNSIPVGLVRFQLKDQEAIIGILLDEKYRGKGLSTGILKDAIESFRRINQSAIKAWIKKDNAASLHTFKKAGFEQIGEEMVNEYPSIIHKFVD